ncbi:Na+/solute symporter [Leucosporidium creatinivorum]|uniref:Na+/solute symporter n=1 Tax=Leucosporidium creatinivorum TaxID=106004 RepID=A0A1Y2DC08_9BASI|nr:Na+/solute symporter [Leucosporidium creatinivorum]
MTQVGEKEFVRLLGQADGYGIVVGIGFAFALVMVGLTWLQAKFTRNDPTSAAEFAAAGRSVKPGLICCGIVSAWTWSATLLQSSSATYQSGLSAAYWYGVGGTIQIAFFAMIAAKVKANANGATTFLQIVKARYGVPCHLLFTFYAMVCVHVVSGSLVLGAAATVNALTGMPIIACNFLLPVGIAVYVIAGGLRATLLCDFIHTVILFVVLYIFVFTAFGTSSELGSPGKLWDLLQDAAIANPVAGNHEGSYTTMRSNPGIVFAGCTIAAGFAGVFCDQGYWQRAIASRPDSTTKAYMLGGLSWFSIPWAFGSTMGLSARAFISNPKFPTYPYPLSAAQQSAGLVAPAAAVVLLGKGGAAAVLLVVFMAATSAASAELIAVSSIIVYDVLGTYGKPLSGAQVVKYSHICIAIFSVWMGAWATILNKAGIDLGWLFYVQGVALTPAVVPIGLTVCWSRQSKHAAFYGTLFGTACGMLGWFVGCYKIYGLINITNLALPYSAISGAGPGLVMSTIATLLLSWIFPDQNQAWTATRMISGSDNDKTNELHPGGENAAAADQDHGHIHAAEDVKPSTPGDEKVVEQTAAVASVAETEEDDGAAALDHDYLQRVFVRAAWISGTMALIVTILIPMPLFGTGYLFSRKFFTAWIAVAMIWLLCAGIFCCILPIWESRVQLKLIVLGLTGMRKRKELV